MYKLRGGDAMGYCIMRIKKIHTKSVLTSNYNHNFRKVDVDNADPALAYKNQELVKLATKNGKEVTYVDAFNTRIASLTYYSEHKLRSNAVLALEAITTFSRNTKLDLESWKIANVKWLKQTFDKAGDNKPNVVSVVYHADEPGNVHCHALIIPIDDKGRLNASFYIDGSRVLSEMQTSYALAMMPFGLERGLEDSGAKHKDIRKFYAELNRAIQVPEPEQNELAADYRNRLLDYLQYIEDENTRKIRAEYARHRRKLAEELILQRDMIRKEMLAREVNLKLKNYELKEKSIRLKQEVSILEQRNEILKLENSVLDYQISQTHDITEKIDFYDNFQEKLKLLNHQAPDKAEELNALLIYMRKNKNKEIER